MSQPPLCPSSQKITGHVQQSEKLSLEASADQLHEKNSGTAIRARFITPLDAVVETASGDRLPAVPVNEAHGLNVLKHQAETSVRKRQPRKSPTRDHKTNGHAPRRPSEAIEEDKDQKLESAI